MKQDNKLFNFIKINTENTIQNETAKTNKNFIFTKGGSELIQKNNNNKYEITNISFVQNEPILNSDNFHDILNEFKNFEKNNTNNLLNSNGNKNKIITLKINLKDRKRLKKNIFDSDSQDTKEINSIKTEQFDLIKELNKINKINSNKDKKIETIDIQMNSPDENSFNSNSNLINNITLKTLGNEEDDNLYYNFQNMNNNYLDNNLNKNTLLDIDNMSENNSNDQEININNNSNDNINNENFFTFNKNMQNQNDFQMPIVSKQNIISSPYQLSSFNSQKEIIFSNNINNENFLSPINTEISPILKMLNNKDGINIKNNINNINININNNGENFPFYSKNSNFEQIIPPFIKKKEQEYNEKYENTLNINNIKNIPINLSKKPQENWKKMTEFLKQKYLNNIKDQNNINNKKNDIINLLLQQLKNNNKLNDSNNFNQPALQITTTVEVKELFNSEDNITDDDNNINSNNSNINKNINNYRNNNIKIIEQNKEIEYNYEPTNLSFINNVDFGKILDKNKYKQIIKQINEHEEIEKIKIKKNEENINNNKGTMYIIDEEEDEYKYDQDSVKASRKNSGLSRSKIYKIGDKNKIIQNSWGSFDKKYSNNNEIYKNNLNDISPKKSKKDFLSFSAKNLNYSTQNNTLKLLENQNKDIDDDFRNNKNKNDFKNANFEILNFNQYLNPEINNNVNHYESKIIKYNKNLSSPDIDNNKINLNLLNFKQNFQKIDEKFEDFILIKKENQDIFNNENNINTDLINSKKSLIDNNKNNNNKNYENNLESKNNNINDNNENMNKNNNSKLNQIINPSNQTIENIHNKNKNVENKGDGEIINKKLNHEFINEEINKDEINKNKNIEMNYSLEKSLSKSNPNTIIINTITNKENINNDILNSNTINIDNIKNKNGDKYINNNIQSENLKIIKKQNSKSYSKIDIDISKEYDFDVDDDEIDFIIDNNKNEENKIKTNNNDINLKNDEKQYNIICNNNFNKNKNELEKKEINNNDKEIISGEPNKDEKIIFNSEDKSDFNKYIESPFNSPIKLDNNKNQKEKEKNTNIKNINLFGDKNSINKKKLSKLNYESLIKKLINLTKYHKNKIIDDKNQDNINIIIQENQKEMLELIFQKFKFKIKDLRDNYIYYLNNKNNCSNNMNKLKKLENKVNIPEKRKELKNIYKDLIKYINNIYKNLPSNKKTSYQMIINSLKEYEKIDNLENIGQNNYINNKGNNNPNQVKDKELLKKYMIGAVLIPLFYLINFFYSNFK